MGLFGSLLATAAVMTASWPGLSPSTVASASCERRAGVDGGLNLRERVTHQLGRLLHLGEVNVHLQGRRDDAQELQVGWRFRCRPPPCCRPWPRPLPQCGADPVLVRHRDPSDHQDSPYTARRAAIAGRVVWGTPTATWDDFGTGLASPQGCKPALDVPHETDFRNRSVIRWTTSIVG
jgi:hypothetical protein